MKLLFLGCAGGRRVTFKQHRGSGGFLLHIQDTLVHVDPGPGAFIRMIQAGIEAENLSAIVLTHRHLDHSADVNVLVEARTFGGWYSGGILVAPEDALSGEDPVVFKYHRKNLDRIYTLKEDFSLSIGGLKVEAALKHEHHGVETYGLIFVGDGRRIGYVTDGRFSEAMLEAYRGCDVLIVNTTFRKPRELDHMCLDDAVRIFSETKPKLGIINHFGMEILAMGLDKAASYVEKNSSVKTIAAREFTEIVFGSDISVSKRKLVNPVGFTPYWRR